MRSLGNSTIFLFLNTGTCSIDSTKFPGIKPNYIYFTDYWKDEFDYLDGGGRDMGSYNFEDGKVESIYPGLSLSHISPPTWIIPSQIIC